MSKVGKLPITVPDGVQIEFKGKDVVVKGREGELKLTLPPSLVLEKGEKSLLVKRLKEDKRTTALHGLYRSLIKNAVIGVDKPWKKELEIVGTGYNVKMQGEDLVFKVGYSHLVVFKKPLGVRFQIKGNNKIIISGPDKQLVGQVAHRIKMIRKPDPYKGKGIRYKGEKIKLKPGKKAKVVGG